jgi:IS30 family transposase
MAKRKYKRLHYEDRQTIEAMSKQGSSVSDIAEALGTHRDTIYREFKRCNATLKTYTAAAGQNQWGTKKSPEAETYIALSKNYAAVIKQLTELVPAAKRKTSRLAALREE